ncbi:MFS transporter [Granulosicoccus sp. 3-233]|uniref:MFS transporter n=1 Tax=Granulosicoccus sp. 3-233 TaxID=3417969 RepID=UPI003D347997
MSGLVALAVAYVLSQFYRSFLAVLTPQLSAELGADKADLSLASGLWFISFALMQFAVGVGLDRFGPRRTATLIFGLAGGGGAFIFAMAQSPQAIVIAMTLIGIGCSPVLMASLFIFAQRFDGRQFAVMTSWLVAFGNLGNVVGSSPLASAVDAFGWRAVMAGLGGLTVLVAAAILLLVEDPEVDAPGNAGLSGYLTLLKTPVLWPIMIMTLLCYAPVAGIRGLWTGPYLTDLFSADSLLIGKVTLWMAIAMIVGNLIYGPLDKLLNTRKWVVFGGNALVLLALLVFVLQPIPGIGVATVLFIIIGAAGTSYGVVMAHGRAFLPPELVGRGVTLVNFCSIFGAGVMQFVTGQLVATQADSSSPMTYQLLFGSYAVLLLLALLVYLSARDAPPGRAQLPGDNARI